MRYVLIIAVVGMLLAVVRQAASANITDASLTTSTPSYSGPCPVTISFTGSITGTPGTSFTYSWIHTVNGSQQTVNGGTVTLNKSSYAVSDSMQISSSAGANTSDQISVYNISPSQTALKSTGPKQTPTAFTVSCSLLNPNVINQVNQANPTKPGKLPPGVLTQAYVAPPTNLAQTGDQTVCGSRGAGFLCPAAMANKWLVLVWCWGPNGCAAASTDQHIDSFRIYEVDGGKHTQVASTNADQYGSLPTAGFVQPPAGGFANQCYAVTAMYGSVESVASNAVCLGNGTTGSTTTALQSTQYGSRYDHYRHQGITSPLSWPLDGQLDCAGAVCVGWFHYTQGGGDITNVVDNAYWRGYYLFDLSSVSHHYINLATLTISTPDWACVQNLGPADSDWWTIQGVSGGDFQPALIVSTSPTSAVYDVTSIVAAWANGAPNHGFVLQGFNENDVAARDNGSCRAALNSSATLTITHS